jgi:cell division protein FtsQ
MTHPRSGLRPPPPPAGVASGPAEPVSRRLPGGATAAPPLLPGDVRLMNAVAVLIFAATTLGLVAAAMLWLARTPWFTIRAIELDGEITRNSLNTIAANTRPRLAGNFFSLDLADTRRSFESVPWVRHAVVRRVWPDRLAVTLEEHRPAALWQGGDGFDGALARSDRLVNHQGEVFEANVGDVEDEALPIFIGPEGSSLAMLQLYRALTPVLGALEAEIDHLTLTSRGSWRVGLDSGATLELGRGGVAEVVARAERFVVTLPELQRRFGRALEYADLRHADGYALRLRGVVTQANPAGSPKTN